MSELEDRTFLIGVLQKNCKNCEFFLELIDHINLKTPKPIAKKINLEPRLNNFLSIYGGFWHYPKTP